MSARIKVSKPSVASAAPPRRPSKYRAVRTEYNGTSYASRAEAKHAELLDTLVRAGEIRGWTRQVAFSLGCPENRYIVDFLVFHVFGSCYAVDVKGMETAKFKRDKKLWMRYGVCPLHLIKGKSLEIVMPEGPKDETP